MAIPQKSQANPIWSNDQLPIVADISDIIEYLDETMESSFTLSLDANELKSLNSNPIQENILPLGNCISSEVFIRFNTGSEEFNFPSNILISFGTTSTIIQPTLVNNLVSIASSKSGVTNLYIKLDWTNALDPANGLIPDGSTFMLKALSGDATLGDSTVDIVVKYRTIEFDA
jgi:hypothetical protein